MLLEGRLGALQAGGLPDDVDLADTRRIPSLPGLQPSNGMDGPHNEGDVTQIQT